jgi:molybdenum cofactor cytidylyltransferase
VITGIVLAAGTSSRFGRTKQLLELEGKPLVQYAVDAAVAAGLDEVVVVLGHDAERVRTSLRLPQNGRTVLNLSYEAGQSTSLIVGLDAAGPESEAAVVLLADQPGITSEHLRALVDAFEAGRPLVVRLRFRDGPGPALLSREVWDEARKLAGDTGAREIITAHPGWVKDVVVDSDAPPDVDRPPDLDRLR